MFYSLTNTARKVRTIVADLCVKLPQTQRKRAGMLLEARDLTIRLQTSRKNVDAVNGTSFSIDDGEVLGVVGESGSGKSVTALGIMGLLDPRIATVSGSVQFGGRDLLEMSAREMQRLRGIEMAMIFQDPMSALNPLLTVGRQLTEVLEDKLGMPRSVALSRAAELFEMVGIPDPGRRIKDYPHEFSGGMRQRILIAIAASCKPRLLIADEPTTALDVTVQAQIIEVINTLRAEFGMGLMWISHDLSVVASLCDRAQVMYGGRIMETGDVDDLFTNPRHPYTKGLLQAIPRLDSPAVGRLTPIPGQPSSEPPRHGCPFFSRCTRRLDKCRENTPPEFDVGVSHVSACWLEQGE